jgi:large subunit ribosomal protein L23
MKINEVLIKPKITEKGLNKVKNSVYLFEVNMKANKNQIKKAVEKIFGVTVFEVKTAVRKGKKRKVGRRMKVKKLSDTKLAYIKLEKGKIDIFPQT